MSPRLHLGLYSWITTNQTIKWNWTKTVSSLQYTIRQTILINNFPKCRPHREWLLNLMHKIIIVIIHNKFITLIKFGFSFRQYSYCSKYLEGLPQALKYWWVSSISNPWLVHSCEWKTQLYNWFSCVCPVNIWHWKKYSW